MSNLPVMPLAYQDFENAVLALCDRALLPDEIVLSFLEQSFNFMENGEMPSVTPAPAAATEGFDAANATAESTLAYILANVEQLKTKCPANGWRVSDIGKQILGLDHHNTGKWIDGQNVGNRKWISDARDAVVAEGLMAGFYVYQGNKYTTVDDLRVAGLTNLPKAAFRIFPKS